MNSRWAILAILAGGLLATRVVSAEVGLSRFEATERHMGAPFTIVLYAPDETTAKQAFAASFARVAELDAMLSDYNPQSELSRLSTTAPSSSGIPVSPPLFSILSRAQELAEQTGGAFDITVGPLVRLWRRARRTGNLPSLEQLEQARTSVGYPNLQLDAKSQTARLLVPGMQLDLGGIAMGYTVDEVLSLLRAQGIHSALVDASGDIGLSDAPPGKAGWIITVAPIDADGAPTRTLVLSNAAVTTSGDSHQHLDIDGHRYSHVIDPRTGMALEDGWSVAIVAKDCLTADSLATAASVLGPTDGIKLVRLGSNAAAWFVRRDGDRWETHNSADLEASGRAPERP